MARTWGFVFLGLVLALGPVTALAEHATDDNVDETVTKDDADPLLATSEEPGDKTDGSRDAKPSSDQLPSMIGGLGDRSYKKREQAQRDLVENFRRWAGEAKSADDLAALYQQLDKLVDNGDPEIRSRMARVRTQLRGEYGDLMQKNPNIKFPKVDGFTPQELQKFADRHFQGAGVAFGDGNETTKLWAELRDARPEDRKKIYEDRVAQLKALQKFYEDLDAKDKTPRPADGRLYDRAKDWGRWKDASENVRELLDYYEAIRRNHNY